ncbi:MAG: hypothetical protein IJK23_14060, partial [Clostridia bacterium]|nr:hypothetical protein [Clostridia bacterium]
PQAAFSNLTTLKSVSINLSKSNLSKSRFFTDDGVMYIRDVDASGNLLDTCKIYLIPYAHAATITLAANVTGFFNADAICNKTQTYTYRHSTHIEGEGVVTKAPTCTAAGVRTYYCIFNPNEAIRTEEIAKLGHKYSTKYTVDTPATCTEDGSESRHCIRCGAKYSGSVRAIPATGHSWGEWKKYTNNYHRRICANDETHTELQKHTWDAGTITTAATCTTDGVKTYKCSVCNGKKTEAIPATGHAWGAWKKLDATQHQRVCATDETHIEKANHTWDAGKVTKAATCTTEGVKTYTCTGCKATKTEPIAIDPANHADYGTDTVNRLDPTCTGTGYTGDKVCRGCGEMLESGQEIPANGHAWKDWTDSGDGANHTRECAVCGEQESAEHVWDAGTVTKTATCKAKGETLYTCTVCGATKKTAIAIDPSNHADYGTEIVNQLDPTCVETGYTGDKVCLGCGQMFEAGQEIPANGHAWKDWTDSGDGANHTRECAVCGEHENAVHVWNDGTVSKEATCAEKGELLYTCTVCGAEKKEAVAIDPDNHADYATHIENAKKATCEKAGYTGDTVCDACGKIVTSGSELAPLGHDWGEWKIVTEPDCVNPGSRVRYCRNSKKHSETEEIPALGHTWQNEEVIRSATCREEGVKRHACAVCGFEEEFAYSDANAHIWEQNGTNIWGTPKWKCSVCGAEEVQRDKPGSSYVEITTEPPVTEPPTEPPTTEAPTTEAPTTEAPTTETPTTETPTTETPITVEPTTEEPTTEEPTTEEPTTEEPTTEAPTTEAPTTEAPSTEAPITEAPTTEAPTTEAPTTEAPTTEAPTTEAPTTEAPTTEAPTTEAPATEPTTPGVPSTNLTVPSTGATVPSVPSQTDSGVTEPKVSYQLGDVNMDGKIKSSDARLALRAAAKLEKLSDLQLLLADANEDGKIKAGDARSILRISARLEPQPDKMIAATV